MTASVTGWYVMKFVGIFAHYSIDSDSQTRLLKRVAPVFKTVAKMDTVPSDRYASETVH